MPELECLVVGRLELLVLASFLVQTRESLLESLHVGDHELGLDDLDIGGRVDLAVDVDDVVVGEDANYLADGVRFTNVGQELVAQTCALGRSLTMPAMSTNDTVAGRMRSEPKISASFCSRGSGSSTRPTLGSMVANG